MPSIHETAYPRFKSNLNTNELKIYYTPIPQELEFAAEKTNNFTEQFKLLVMLKTFQHLGRFISVKHIPTAIVQNIADNLELREIPKSFATYDKSGAKTRHANIIRKYLAIVPFEPEGRKYMHDIAFNAAKTKNDLADIINIILEELVKRHFELPGFSTLVKTARAARSRINNNYFKLTYAKLKSNPKALKQINSLLKRDKSRSYSLWYAMKQEPKKPTVKNTKEFIKHLQWLEQLATALPNIQYIPTAKRQYMVDEAIAQDIKDMHDLKLEKRFTLATVLLKTVIAKARDDIAEMFIKLTNNLHKSAQKALKNYKEKQNEKTDSLIIVLHDVMSAYQAKGTKAERFEAIFKVVKDDPESIMQQCDEYIAYTSNNYLPFMLSCYIGKRAVLFDCINTINLYNIT